MSWVARCCVAIAVAHTAGAAVAGRRAVRVVNGKDTRVYDPAKPLRVLSWNVQYCAGTTEHFFYDGGRAVSAASPRRQTVRSTLARVAEAIAAEDPDLVLLQEVDRQSLRTGFIDEHAALLDALGGRYASHCSAWYWRVPWVPHPRHQHIGRVNMHLSVFSRFALDSASRVPLPLLREPLHRRLFNLRRAVLAVALRCADGQPPLSVFNTHLSAFSNADGTLVEQVRVLAELGAQVRDGRWLLAGDLNALPPGVPAARHLDAGEAQLYGEAESPISPLYRGATPALPAAEMADPARASKWFSYKPFHRESADRTIDHAFVGAGLTVESARVVQTGGAGGRGAWPSDHLPIMMEVRCR